MSGRDFDTVMAAGPETGRPAPAWRVGSALDDWWGRRSSPTRTLLRVAAPTAVMLTAGLTRLIGLGHPAELVFDETYYVKDAWTTWNLGYEAAWPQPPAGEPEDWVNREFAAGRTDLFLTDPAFAVHPPLGKWLIALGMAAVGPGNPFGWRIAVAIAGIALVGLTMLVAHRLTRSLVVATLAGGLLAIDGNGIVMSRIGLLDTFLALFALLGFWFVLLDRARTRRTGAFWNRPWLIAAGLALGAATAVKWSGLWFIVVFGVWTVVADAIDRRDGWEAPRRAPVNFLLFVPPALAVYLASFSGWFATEGGYYRQWAAQGDHAWTGFFSWVPLPVQSFLHLQGEVLRFHADLHSDHPYKSQAWSWLILGRPTAFWYQSATPDTDPSCTADSCGALITDLPNPLIWYASIAALVWLVVIAVRRLDRPAIAVLIGFGAGFVPWLFLPERTTYFFYSIAYQPFLIIGLALALRAILGRRDDERSRRTSGIVAVAVFLGVATALSAFFWPVWTGAMVDLRFLQLHYWSPTWI
ncbi:MAG: phospholipid carrier-dependent glycosyltransferase [Microbacteriaceae bacterium]|nr:phospholipid carrier-dependent glycosyltransferase [Microbacteriaceae bacterium]